MTTQIDPSSLCASLKLAGVILDMLYAYDARMNSKIILKGEGFNSPSIAIGKHISQSMVGGIPSSPRASSISRRDETPDNHFFQSSSSLIGVSPVQTRREVDDEQKSPEGSLLQHRKRQILERRRYVGREGGIDSDQFRTPIRS